SHQWTHRPRRKMYGTGRGTARLLQRRRSRRRSRPPRQSRPQSRPHAAGRRGERLKRRYPIRTEGKTMASQQKSVKADHPVLPVITERWSPYLFEPRPVEREKLLSCLEAARWAPSSYNEQPWTFILAERTDQKEFARMVECLVEG